MRPKWYFALKAIIFIVGAITVFITLLYIISFIFFVLRQTGVWFVPIFGLMGIGVFLTSLPWLLIVLAVIFVVLLEVLVKQHSIAYSKPILYSLLIIVVLAGLSGFVISKAGVHEKFYEFAERNKMPFAARIYRDYGFKDYRQVHPVIVEEITEQGLKVKNCKGQILTITTSTETKLFPLEIGFGPNDRLVVLGKRSNGSVVAVGIKKIKGYFKTSQDCLFLPMMHK
jgi:hypothetical protein